MAGVSQVLVGLGRVGLVGLRQAIEAVDASGLEDPEQIVSLMMEMLDGRNYISPASRDEYRRTLLREYLRHRGEDIRHLYSQIEVVVRAQPGPELDRLREILVAVFARHELEPLIALQPPDSEGPSPELWIGEEMVTAGTVDADHIARRVAKQISHW